MKKPFETAMWIGMGKGYKPNVSPLLRTEFVCEKNLKQAVLHITGVGFYEAWINETRIGDKLLEPAQTNYEQQVIYSDFDVTTLMEPKNCLSVMLGDGWFYQNKMWRNPNIPHSNQEMQRFSFSCENAVYGNPMLLCSLELLYNDGHSEKIESNNQWKTTFGPITSNNLYYGETYDARFAPKGWKVLGYDDSTWTSAVLEAQEIGEPILSKMEPVRAVEQIDPISINCLVNGVYVYDMGVNFAGVVRLQGYAFSGMELRMRFAESLRPDGSLQYDNYHQIVYNAIQEDRYIAAEDGWFIWQPSFVFHGFRYVELCGLSYPAQLENVTGIRMHTDLCVSGEFECSELRLNQMNVIASNTIRSNLFGLPMDCPIRERCGWTGDALVLAESLSYMFDSDQFWRKYIDDLHTTKEIYGDFTCIAPGRRTCIPTCAAWGAAWVLIPWEHYRFYGDKNVLRQSFSDIQDWVNWLNDHAKKEGLLEGGLGDWWAPKEVFVNHPTGAAVSNAYYYRSVKIAADIAEELNEHKVAQQYSMLMTKIQLKYNEQFFNPLTGDMGGQGISAMALEEGLVLNENRTKAIEFLLNDIRNTGYHFYAGHIGMKYLFSALCHNDAQDVLLKVLQNDDYPGFGYMLNQGATTLWERWEGDADFKDYKQEYIGGSLNHSFKSGYVAWFYSGVLGITPEKPGFASIHIKPCATKMLNSASGYYLSKRGRIEVTWKSENGRFTLDVKVPDQVPCTVFMPDGASYECIKSGHYTCIE